MEQHPVPRNITGFQFRLIGDMTLRQFGYLIAGAIIAYLVFKIAPFPKLVNVLLASLSGLAGVAFAFLPIQERPLDKWMTAFVKSITSPTQYTWRKANPVPSILIHASMTQQKHQTPKHIQNNHQDAKKKLQAYLSTLPKHPHEHINIREKKYIENTLKLFSNLQSPSYDIPRLQAQPLSTPPTAAPLKPETTKQSTSTQSSFQASKPTSSPVKPAVSKQPVPFVSPRQQQQDVQRQLSRLAEEKKLLQEELNNLQKTLKEKKEKEVLKPKETEKEKKPTIKTVASKTAVSKMGIPNLPQQPNIIIGAVKDPEGKILPNIILTIKDKKGMPLRALKTNKLGQFQTATPLPNGTYYLETEDPLKRYVFDTAEITLSGKPCLPIEITAKGEKELMREKLTKQLFGNSKSV